MAPFDRGQVERMLQLAYLIDLKAGPYVLRLYDVKIGMIAAGDQVTGTTLAARPLLHLLILAEKSRSQPSRQCRLSHPRRPGEEVSVGDAVSEHGSLQRPDGPLVPYDLPVIIPVHMSVHGLQSNGEDGIIRDAVGG